MYVALGFFLGFGHDAVCYAWYTRAQKKNQIKYLRVPDTLLDTVKEEQARAREVGRSARGAGPGPRGTPAPFPVPRSPFLFFSPTLFADRDSPLRPLPCPHHPPITHMYPCRNDAHALPPLDYYATGAGGRGLPGRGTSLPPTLHPATHISHTSVPPRRTWRRPGRTAWSPRQRQGMTTIGDHRPHAHRRGCTYHACCTKMGPMRTENGSHPDRLRFRTLVMVHRWTVKRTRICDAFPLGRVPDDVACATSSHLRSMGGTCSLIESRPPSKLTRQVGETGQISDFCFTSPAEPRPS